VEYAAIDLHKKESQVRIVTNDGQVLDRRVPTTRQHFTTLFWGRERTRILLEASTESEWVAPHLETLGHDVIVADPNYAPMYGQRSRRIKTDQRDVAALAEACQSGVYRAVHRRSAQYRVVQLALTVRDELVQSRTRAISVIRATIRGGGFRIRSGATESFLTRLGALELPPSMVSALTPLRTLIEVTTEELARVDARFEGLVATDPIIQRLTTFPGIGPITASAYVAAIDDVARFPTAGAVTSYLGLVPREYSSGEHQRRGRILRSSHPRVQSLLVQAAWRLSRSRRPETAILRQWAVAIQRRRGVRIAQVALARRLARILYAMWRDASSYDGGRVHRRTPHTASPGTGVAEVVAP
jgi:transposase